MKKQITIQLELQLPSLREWRPDVTMQVSTMPNCIRGVALAFCVPVNLACGRTQAACFWCCATTQHAPCQRNNADRTDRLHFSEVATITSIVAPLKRFMYATIAHQLC